MPSCWSRNRAWLSSSRNMATRTSPPSMTFCSAERAWMAARWRTRSMPMVCCGSALTASGSRSTVSLRNFSRRCRSRFTLAPQATRIFWVLGSRVRARSRCSSVRYSWRIAFASAMACRKLAWSSLAMSGVATVLDLLRFHRQAERKLVLPGQRLHHLYLRTSHVKGINACHADARVVHVEHDRHRVGLRFVEHLAQDRHHEVAGRVVVVVEENLVELRPLELPLALAFRLDSAVRLHALGHRPT